MKTMAGMTMMVGCGERGFPRTLKVDSEQDSEYV
jgi:hypothetical protein